MPNSIVVEDSTVKVTTKNGDVFLTSLCDLETVSRYSWYVVRGTEKTKSHVGTAIRQENGKQKTFSLDYFLFPEKPKGSQLRHINGNYLDFRRENIENSNTLRIDGDITFIPVTPPKTIDGKNVTHLEQNLEAKIDTDDVTLVQSIGRKWQCLPTGYIFTKKTIGGKIKTIYLHRLIMDAPPELTVDHIDHDTLNNRKSNLRIVTQEVNSQNRIGSDVDSKTGVRGVYFWTGRGYSYYVAHVRTKEKVYSEYFPHTEDGLKKAAVAAERLRQEHFTHSK